MSVRIFPVALLALAGCFDPDPGPIILGPLKVDLGPAPVMTLVSGANQTVPVGSEFGAPVRVRLAKADGTPMSNEPVSFHFQETMPGMGVGGIVTGERTNTEGVAEARFTPTRAGTFTVRAYFEECEELGFSTCVKVVVRAEVTVPGTAVAP